MASDERREERDVAGGSGRAGTTRARRGPMYAQVTDVLDLTPRMRRVRLAGDDLVGLEPAGPDQRVKLVFPEDRTFTDSEEFGRARRRRRTYTLLDLDARAGTAAVDLVLHGGGVAGEWARRARPGDEVAMTAPVGRHHPAIEGGGDHLLVGDETALPAMRAILAQLPAADRARVHVEIADAAERQELPADADVEITWWHRDETGAGPGELMAALPERLTGLAPATRAWVAGEAAAVRAVRTHLLAEAGLPRAQVDAVAYWTLGRAES